MKYANYSRRNSSFSRFIPIILVVVITLVAIAAVIAIGRSLFGGGDQPAEQQKKIDIGKEALLSTDVNRSVRLTVRGPIVSEEKFRSYQITVSPNERIMTTYEGYLDKQIESKKLSNNSRAYEEFVYALDKRKMMEGVELDDQQNDLRGICATGKVYKMETLMGGSLVKSLWTSDCGGSKGSAKANVTEISEMFLKQIPDGKKIASTVGLSYEEAFLKF